MRDTCVFIMLASDMDTAETPFQRLFKCHAELVDLQSVSMSDQAVTHHVAIM